MSDLLLHCPFASELWDMVFGLFGVHSMMPKDVVDLLVCCQGRLGRHRNSVNWKVIPLCNVMHLA